MSMRRATLYLKSGQVFKIKVSETYSVNASDYTASTVHRFPRRGLFVVGMIFVQGDNIAAVVVE